MASNRKTKPAEPPQEAPTPAAAAVPPNMSGAVSLFRGAGVTAEPGVDKDPWTIDGRFRFWPGGHWSSFDGRHRGSTARALIEVIKSGTEPPPDRKTLRERIAEERAEEERAMRAGLAAVADALDPTHAPVPEMDDCQGERVQ